jgi:hypothetical protein
VFLQARCPCTLLGGGSFLHSRYVEYKTPEATVPLLKCSSTGGGELLAVSGAVRHCGAGNYLQCLVACDAVRIAQERITGVPHVQGNATP